ncbi:MAG: sulfatase-like hydrolase/transferase [Bryobacteraceae bacterium]
MTRRQLLTSALAAGPLTTRVARAAGRPNIVMLLADDLGASDLSSYQCPDIKTPHIDSLGRRGVRFTQAYSNAPECSPTRTGFLTGRYQQRVGGLECAIGVGNVGRYDEAEWLAARGELGLPVSETSIARMLRDAGYATCCSGKWHLGYTGRFAPNAHGFDEYFGILGGNADYITHREEDGTNVLYRNGKPVERTGHATDLIADHAIDWLARVRPRDKPFFLYVPFTAPHTPLQGPGDAPVADKSKWNAGTRATYVRMVEHMDRRVGDILTALDRAGAASDTLVIFKSDNGGYNRSRNVPFRGAKSSCWEGGIRVPCLMRWPGVLPADATTTQVAITMDVSATILAAAQVRPTRPLDGMDLLPILTGKKKPVPRTLYWSYKRAKTRRWAVRDGDTKYVIDDGAEHVFDLAADVEEKVNLAERDPAATARLRGKLAAWKKEVEPPRLREFRQTHPETAQSKAQ